MRPGYSKIVESLSELDLAKVNQQAQTYLAKHGVFFHTSTGAQPFVVDLMPRVISVDEWQIVSAGLTQRVAALNRFVADIYSEQQIIAAGVVPRAAVEQAEYFEPDLVGATPPAANIYTHVAGLDLVRGNDGTLRVLEDNVRSPSGLTFSLAARRTTDNVLEFAIESPKLDIVGVLDVLADALQTAAPSGSGDPKIALVSDGPSSAAWYEHKIIADALNIDLVTLDQLEIKKGAVCARIGRRRKPIEVIYRRTDLDRLRDSNGNLTQFGELLLEPLRAGKIASVNAFGTGVADDKLIHAYVEEIIRFYLGEEPLLESVRTYDPSNDDTRAMVLERIGELVVKPRGGLGGADVTIGPKSTHEQVQAAKQAVERHPDKWVAQETVALSTHPTVVDNTLEPRHIDLRPYAVHTPNGVDVLPACLTRVALQPGGLIVNSSQNGGAKDTWISAE